MSNGLFTGEGMLEAIGWLGGICFAFSAIPQARLSHNQGHSKGISAMMLWLWFWGELLTSIYVIQKSGFEQLPLLFNYAVNFICLIIIIKFKIKPR